MSNALPNHDIFTATSSAPAAPLQTPKAPIKAVANKLSAATPQRPVRPEKPSFLERSIAGRKPDDYVFIPKESAFFHAETVEIQSLPMQVAFKKSFQRSALALFETDLIVPIIASSDEKAREVFLAVDTIVTKFTEWASGETARVEAILDSHGVKRSGEFSEPLVTAVRVYSPRLYPIIALFRAIDNLIFLKSLLWITGHLDEIEYKRACYDSRVRMLRLARKLWEIHSNAISQLHKERRQAIDEANDERDERSRREADLRAKRVEQAIQRVADRQSAETDEDRIDPLGQEELEVEMGKSLDEAEAEQDGQTKAPRKRAKRADAA